MCIWLGNLCRLDLGRSFSDKHAVAKLIGERIGPTLLLSVTSLVLAYLLSIPMGLCSPPATASLDERDRSTALYMLYSLPAFVAALFLQCVLSVKLDWLPLFGMTSDNYDAAVARGARCGTVLARADAGRLLHLRQPGLRQPVHPRQHAGGHPAGLHPHGAGQGRAARSASSCITRFATR